MAPAGHVPCREEGQGQTQSPPPVGQVSVVRSVLSPRPIQVGQEQTVLNPPLEGAAGWRHAWASDSEETRFCEPAFPSPADAPFPRSSVTLAAPPGDPSFCITAWLRVPTGALEHTASAGPQAKGLQGL